MTVQEGEKVRIICHTCGGLGAVKEKVWPSEEEIAVVCPECKGEKFVWARKALLMREHQFGRTWSQV